jgi:isoquinoline 1-oxidoreductase subunit beta
MARPTSKGIDRRTLLIGGGASVGLVLAWQLWPRSYAPNLAVREGETALNAFLKIDTAGRVTVICPQAEMGQGIGTAFAQIVADELGADWRQVGIEPAPPNPLYANRLLAGENDGDAGFLAEVSRWRAREGATRATAMVTAGSSSIRAFEPALRTAGAVGRALLCMAAGARLEADWRACDTEAGFVVRGDDRIRFSALAEHAAEFDPPADVPLRTPGAGGIAGRSVPRLDYPAKVDGTIRFAGDVRLPGMLFASIWHGPLGDTHLNGADLAAADLQAGVSKIVRTDRWVAALASNWWAADRALDQMAPRFATPGPLLDSAAMSHTLRQALTNTGETAIVAEVGEIEPLLQGTGLVEADYDVPLQAHATIEPAVATARVSGDRLELWAATQAPAAAVAAVAAATEFGEGHITLYPMPIGGGFGRALDHQVIVEAAVLAVESKRPVQLMWSRREELLRAPHGPPARARLRGRLDPRGRIAAWEARIATPAGANRIVAASGTAEPFATTGAVPPYAIPATRIAYAAAELPLATGVWRSGAHAATAFFTECFIDELAAVAAQDPLSFRMAMLGGSPRLARCLSQAAAAGGWSAEPGAGQGLACHSAFGSHIALLVEAGLESETIRVARMIAVADIGRAIHPDSARQQIESGLVWGLASAIGRPIRYARGIAEQRTIGDLRLPLMADMPEIIVALVPSTEAPGGVAELGVPVAAPAIANALASATGKRLRSLPLMAA